MYPRFVKVFLNNQLEGMDNHTRTYVIPSHTKKVFGNMRRVGKDFSGNPFIFIHDGASSKGNNGEERIQLKELMEFCTNLQNRVFNLENTKTAQAQEIDSLKRRVKKLERRQKSKTDGLKRLYKETRLSGPKTNVEDEAFIEETDSKHSNDPLHSGEERIQLKELMEFCTNLQNRVFNLENTKTAQAQEIDSLKRRVKKLERRQKSKTDGLKRLYKVGLSARVESFDKESLELKRCLEIVSDDRDDVTIDATPLSYNKMLKNFDREDLEVLWRLVKDRFVKTKPVDNMDSFLIHALKTMFEHHVEDNAWKIQQGLVKIAFSALVVFLDIIQLLGFTNFEDDPDIIHVDNSSDLALTTSLNDLKITTLHIDGQSIDVDAPPDIIDVDEDDDIIDDLDVLPHDLADSGDEDLVSVDDDDGMSADVVRGHDDDGGSDDRPIPHHQGHPKPQFERQDAYPEGNHEPRANLPEEIVREFPMHFGSWRGIPPKRKAGVLGNIGTQFDLTPHMQSELWPEIKKGIDQHIGKIYMDNKSSSLKRDYWVKNHDGEAYDCAQNARNWAKSMVVCRQGSWTLAALRDRQAEMQRLQGLGTYTDDQIMAMVREGKQCGHILGVGRYLTVWFIAILGYIASFRGLPIECQQNRGQGTNPRGGGAAGYEGVQNRVGNANLGQAIQVKCYNYNGIGHIARNCTQPKLLQNFDYYKDKMLLVQAQENRVALDEEQLLFLAGGQDNVIDEDVDEQPVHDLALNMDNVFQADDCDAFDYDVDEAPTAQTMFMANLSSADPIYDEAGPSYDSDILSEVQNHDHYHDVVCEHHEEYVMHENVQQNHVIDSHVDYTSDSNMISYDQYVKDDAVLVVHSNVSSVLNDAYMMIYNDMYEPHARSASKKFRITVVENSLTGELATYKEQVKLGGYIVRGRGSMYRRGNMNGRGGLSGGRGGMYQKKNNGGLGTKFVPVRNRGKQIDNVHVMEDNVGGSNVDKGKKTDNAKSGNVKKVVERDRIHVKNSFSVLNDEMFESGGEEWVLAKGKIDLAVELEKQCVAVIKKEETTRSQEFGKNYDDIYREELIKINDLQIEKQKAKVKLFFYSEEVLTEEIRDTWTDEMIVQYEGLMGEKVRKIMNESLQGSQMECMDDEVVEDISGTPKFMARNEVSNVYNGKDSEMQESHLRKKIVNKVFNEVFRKWAWVSNSVDSKKGCRIVVGWDPAVFTHVLLSQSSQVMHFLVKRNIDGKEIFVSFVYGEINVVDRRDLWKNIKDHNSVAGNFPWVLLGDFNVILNYNENYRGIGVNNVGVHEFRDYVEAINIEDVKMTGLFFTRIQKRKDPNSGILKKLDRVMVNGKFVDEYINGLLILFHLVFLTTPLLF
nr:hypothetical protein [Tanacetum cinerariifolium]